MRRSPQNRGIRNKYEYSESEDKNPITERDAMIPAFRSEIGLCNP
jgi:hypothetical protein